MTMTKKGGYVRFIGYDCDVLIRKYHANKQASIQLVIADTDYNRQRTNEIGDPMTTATACMPGYPFANNETAIKDYGENTGVLNVLLDAGIVESTGKIINSGFAVFPVVRLKTIH